MAGPRRQLPFDFAHRPSYRSEDFLAAAPNAEALAWLDRWPDWPSTALILYGPAGCGKTHFVHLFQERTGAIAVDATSLGPDRADAPAVVIDDADALAGAEFETPLFHLYNSLHEEGQHLLLTAHHPPAQWPLRLADLRSRMMASLAVGIGAPDDALMAQVLVKLFSDRQLKVEPEVIPYLTARMERSFDAARRLVADLDRTGLAEGRAITLPLARRVLAATDG
jgi:DnaA regulatory inactivator Hda